jgi:hypothetical protein
VRRGKLQLEADLAVYGNHSSANVFHEILNALQASKTRAHIKVKINDIAIQMDREPIEEEEAEPVAGEDGV